MLSPKSFYFFYFAAFAALLPFLVLYYEQLGFTGQQIGILTALFPLMMMAGAPVWSFIADITGRHKSILISLMLLSILLVLNLNTNPSFQNLTLLISGFAFFIAPVIPLGDNAVLELLGENKANYGRIRVWGAVGWGLSAPLAGILTERFNLSWAFFAYVLLMLFCMISSANLPFKPKLSAKPQANLKAFLSADWLLFLSAIFLGGAGLAVSGTYVYLQLTALNAAGFIVGLALTAATLSELPLTFYGKQLLERFSSRQLLGIALACLCLRLFLYGWADSAFLILVIQLLHGFSFSVIWIAGVAYADAFAPEGKSATAQGLFNAVMMGLGSAAGGFLGGYLYDAVGLSKMFQWVALGILLASTLLMTLWYLKPNAKSAQARP